VAEELARLVATENECCSWAKWSVDAVAGEVVLDATSTGAGATALHSMLTKV
jgi:hypothetical protein